MVTKKPLLIVMWGVLLALLLVLPLGAAQSTEDKKLAEWKARTDKWKKQLGACEIFYENTNYVLFAVPYRPTKENASCAVSISLYYKKTKISKIVFAANPVGGSAYGGYHYIRDAVLKNNPLTIYAIDEIKGGTQPVIAINVATGKIGKPLFTGNSDALHAVIDSIFISPDEKYLGISVGGMVVKYEEYLFGPLYFKTPKLIPLKKRPAWMNVYN